MTWRCGQDCGAHGSNQYASAEDAKHYARAFDREDSEDLGPRAPLIGHPLNCGTPGSGSDTSRSQPIASCPP
ncbi:hypothetical protein [Streptomyces sp. NPDC051219]|uniref:hypothetical protein n=1 Tax=Streptomyces sp. NPDC051219 TaxID=3155283 RepID=UPI00341E965A